MYVIDASNLDVPFTGGGFLKAIEVSFQSFSCIETSSKRKRPEMEEQPLPGGYEGMRLLARGIMKAKVSNFAFPLSMTGIPRRGGGHTQKVQEGLLHIIVLDHCRPN